jgi:ABC-type uncharacterized transport system substrate-binding protein
MDYGFVESVRGRDAAELIDQILHGANAANLPMRPPSQFEVVLNPRAAERIGYAFQVSVEDQATETIP